jgi:hypothetical protein
VPSEVSIFSAFSLTPARRRLTRRCSEPHHHKVLGRGRPGHERTRALRARVLRRWRAVAELSS